MPQHGIWSEHGRQNAVSIPVATFAHEAGLEELNDWVTQTIIVDAQEDRGSEVMGVQQERSDWIVTEDAVW